MKNKETISTLLSLPSLSCYGKKAEIVVRNRLVEILSKRLSGNISSYKTENYLGKKIPYSLINQHLILKYIESNPYWDFSEQYFGAECDYNEVNQSGKVVFDVSDFYIIGAAQAMAGGLNYIDRETLEEALSFSLDWEEDSPCEEEWISSLILLADDMQKAITCGTTDHELLAQYISDFTSICFGEYLSEETFVRHLDTMLDYIAGRCEGSNRQVFVIRSKHIASYLKIRDMIPASEEKDLVEQAIEVISNPLDEGWCGLSGFTSLEGENKEWFSSVFFLGDNSSQYVTLYNIKPFFLLAMEIIDQLVPKLLKNIYY